MTFADASVFVHVVSAASETSILEAKLKKNEEIGKGRWGRGSLLACCIYVHFLSSLNRAGCAGNLSSPLQMVCIMFKPSCHQPSLAQAFSPSLPFSINHQNLKLYVFKKKKGIRKSYKMGLDLFSPPHPPLPSTFALPPALSWPLVTLVSWSWCSHIWLPRNQRGSRKTPHKGRRWPPEADYLRRGVSLA